MTPLLPRPLAPTELIGLPGWGLSLDSDFMRDEQVCCANKRKGATRLASSSMGSVVPSQEKEKFKVTSQARRNKAKGTARQGRARRSNPTPASDSANTIGLRRAAGPSMRQTDKQAGWRPATHACHLASLLGSYKRTRKGLSLL